MPVSREQLARLAAMHERDRAALLWHEPNFMAANARFGLTFKPGDTVIDLATGERCEVIDGKRLNIVF